VAKTAAVGALPAARPGSSRPWLIATLLAVGIALRVWQYLGDTSLWFDELSIARNIHERSFIQLMMEPLGYNQIAPVGFLAVVKGSTLLLGSTDMALRLFPFLCGLLSLILFWRVAERALDPISAAVALALFAVGLPFILYTTTLKQYGSDIAATLALIGITLDLRASPASARRCAMAGLAGFAIAWFSQAAMLVMGGLALIRQDRRAVRTRSSSGAARSSCGRCFGVRRARAPFPPCCSTTGAGTRAARRPGASISNTARPKR
jgi:hypothetical protein